MHVIPAGADVCLTTAWIRARLPCAPEPGIVLLRSAGLGAAIFVFERERHAAEEARAFFADIASKQKRADVLADAVVEVRVPALGCSLSGFQRTKMSSGASPSRMAASLVWRARAAPRRAAAPGLSALASSDCC